MPKLSDYNLEEVPVQKMKLDDYALEEVGTKSFSRQLSERVGVQNPTIPQAMLGLSTPFSLPRLAELSQGAPTIGGIIGGAAGPIGAGLGTGIGVGVRDIVRNVAGEQNTGLSDFAKQAALESLLAAGGQKLGGIVFSRLGRLAETPTAKNIIQKIPDTVRRLPVIRSIFQEPREQAALQFAKQVASQKDTAKSAYNAMQQAEKLAYLTEKEAAKTSAQGLSGASSEEVGLQFSDSLLGLKKEAGQMFDDMVGSVYSKFKNAKVSVEPVRQYVVDNLKQLGVMDDAGKIIQQNVQKIISPERKNLAQSLIKVSNNLKANPTLNGLKTLQGETTSLARAAYNSGFKTPEQAVLSGLDKTVRNNMLEAVGEVAGAEAGAALQASREAYKNAMNLLEPFESLIGQAPEKIAKVAGAKMAGSFAREAIENNPMLQDSFSGVLLKHLGDKASSPQALTKAINNIGRQNLKKVLGENEFNTLVAAETRFRKAYNAMPKKSPFKFDEPQFIPQKDLIDSVTEIFVSLPKNRLTRSALGAIGQAGAKTAENIILNKIGEQ